MNSAMRTIKFIALTAAAIVALVGCKDELYIYNSATLDYAGRFVVTQLIADLGSGVELGDTAVMHDELHIYNTAADVASDIWVDFKKGGIKAKQTISGSPESFSSSQWGVNMSAIELGDKLPLTVAAGRDTSIDGVAEAAMRITSAAIVKGGAVSPGGNTVDALNTQVELCEAKVFYKSVLRAKSVWADSTKAEYGWQYSHIEPDESTASPVKISGYRYTGLPEDE